MIFKQIYIQNYQSHKNSIIDFTEGLNILVGPTNAGKSAIIRALQKLIRDDPAGKDFINEDTDWASIELIFEKDSKEYKVTRTITPTKNQYFLEIDNIVQDFGGFGREIPEEIQKALEMFLIELENNNKIDLHFLEQHDAPFMISKGSAGTRSKILGRIGGLHILDKGITHVNKDIRQENSELKIRLEEKNTLQTELETFPNMQELENNLKYLYDQFNQVNIQIKTKDELKTLYNNLVQLTTKGKQLKNYVDSIPSIDVDFNNLRQKLVLVNQLKELNTKLLTLGVAIRNIENKKVPDINADFNLTRKNIRQLENLKTLNAQLNQVNLKISTINVVKITLELEETKNKWVSLLKELKVCPTCKQSTINVGEFYEKT